MSKEFLENLQYKTKLDGGPRYVNQSLSSTRKNDNSDITGQGAGTKAWIHDSIIIKNGATNPEKAGDRTIMALYQEYASVIVFKVADLLTKNEITIYNRKANLKGKKEKRQINNAGMFFWRKWNLQNMLRKAIEFMREQGIVIYTKNKRYSHITRLNEEYWTVLSMQHINVINDRQGILVNIQGQETVFNSFISFILKANEMVFFDPEQTDNKIGKSALTNVWNKLLSLECIGSSLEIFLERLGLGFIHVDMPIGTPAPVKTAVKNAIKNLRQELGIYTESDEKNKPTVEFKSPNMNAIFEQVMNGIKDDIAVGSQLPMRFFQSEDETDAVIQKTLLSLSNKYEIFIRKILVFEGIINDINEVEIDFNIGKPTLDIEINQVEIAKNSMIAGKLWMTVNEKRELDDLPPIEGGDEINPMGKTDQVNTSNSTGFESSSFEGDEKTKPEQFEKKQLANETSVEQSKTTDTVIKDKEKKDSVLSKPTLDSVVDETGYTGLKEHLSKSISKHTVRSLSKEMGVSEGTAAKILKFTNTNDKDFSTKMDSYKVVGNKVHFSAIMLAPNPKLRYNDINGNLDHFESQSPAEVAKWFNDGNVTKELNLGVEMQIPHNGSAEVPRLQSIGIIKAVHLDSAGNVHAEGFADLDKIDKFLGKNNYVRQRIKNKQDISLSAGMRARDVQVDSQNIKRMNLDVRSVMIVEKGRNDQTLIKENDTL